MVESIWIEKYRPHDWLEIKGQDVITSRIKAFIDSKNMPHLLFSGPAGVGKSTTALVIAKKLYGDNYNQNFLELNSSDERKLDVVRTKIKDFARVRPMGDVPFKIIFLDECDAMTKDAQHALRRIMENFTSTTRFILSCNYSSKIIDPIQSRCAIFRFKPLSKDAIYQLIDHIAHRESLIIDDKAKSALFYVSEGDCRKLENVMQSCAVLSMQITEDLIFDIVSAARPEEITHVIKLAYIGKFLDAKKKLLDTMLNHGLSGYDVIKQMSGVLFNLDFILPKQRLDFMHKIGEVEFRLVEGSDEYVQLEAFLAYVTMVGQTVNIPDSNF